jgi:L-alanine-DL-glutamate epimerase-like enolase superfamily enzyme
MSRWRIKAVRTYLIETLGAGGNYTSREPGHWMVNERQVNPMSIHPDRPNLRAGTAAADGGVLLEIETDDGTVGMAAGSGGNAVCSIIEQGLWGFLVGAAARDIARLWDQMYRATLPFGPEGSALLAISVSDLALWDLLGQLRSEPIYRLAGGATRERLAVYGTGPKPQPDLMWAGGFSEALRIASLASACDVTVVPHAGGINSYHFAMTQPSVPMVEYCITSPKAHEITPVFGGMFDGEPLPLDDTIKLSDSPGWGLQLKREHVQLKRFVA